MSESIRKESSDPINVGDLFGKPATEKTLQRIADSLERSKDEKERLETILLDYVEATLKEPSKKSASEIEAVPPIAQILLKLWGIS